MGIYLFFNKINLRITANFCMLFNFLHKVGILNEFQRYLTQKGENSFNFCCTETFRVLHNGLSNVHFMLNYNRLYHFPAIRMIIPAINTSLFFKLFKENFV